MVDIYQNPITTHPEMSLKSTQPSSEHSPQPPPKGCSGRRGWAEAGAGPITAGSTAPRHGQGDTPAVPPLLPL